MGCLKLHILDQQYKNAELKVSYINKELTLKNSAENVRSGKEYLYNGKELQDDNLGGTSLGVYDYGARMYDPMLGRWMTIDPLADEYVNFSPYSYCLNNPVLFIDPDGMRVIAKNEESQKLIMDMLNELLGPGHGFSFSKSGELKYKARKDENSKNDKYNDDQKSISSGMQEVVSNEDYTINVYVQESDEKTTVDFVGQGLVTNDDGKIVYENGKPKLEEKVLESYEITRPKGESGGGTFVSKESYKNANMFVFPGIAKDGTYPSTDGNRYQYGTTSPVTAHELLDHGVDYVRTGNNNRSSGAGQENVKYQNNALKILKKQERVSHTR